MRWLILGIAAATAAMAWAGGAQPAASGLPYSGGPPRVADAACGPGASRSQAAARAGASGAGVAPGGPSQAADGPGGEAARAAFLATLEARVPRWLARYGVPGASIALVEGGRPVWVSAFGVADLHTRAPLTPDAVFRVESLSKPVTARGIMVLVEQGLLGLDEPVQHYLGDWQFPPSPHPVAGITLRRLLSHSAGLPLGDVTARYGPGAARPPPDERLAAEAVPVARPGSGFAYSNVGFNLADLLVEEVTGRPFAAAMHELVLSPLGMRDASFAWPPALAPRIPTAYDSRGRVVPVHVYPAKGAGGLFATAGDMARFAAAAGSGHHALYRPVVHTRGPYALVSQAYGLGHFLETLSDGRLAAWHGGQGAGWMSHLHMVPESGAAIVVLTNSQRAWPLFARVLERWSAYLGVAPVRMVRILQAERIAVLAVALALACSALLLLSAGRRLLRRGRPAAGPAAGVQRAGAGLLGAMLLGALVWAWRQPWLLLGAVMPHLLPWLAAAATALGAALLTSAAVGAGRSPASGELQE